MVFLKTVSYTLCVLNGLTNPLQAYTLRGGIKDSPNIYKPPTRLLEMKTDFPSIYNAITHFEIAKKDFLNFHKLFWDRLNGPSKPTTCIANVKTDSPNIHKPPIRFAVGKLNNPKIYKPSTGQNGLAEFLQASYTLCDCRNGLSGLLQPWYTHCRVQTVPPLLQASHTFCGVKTDTQSFYKLPTRLTVIKMESASLNKP